MIRAALLALLLALPARAADRVVIAGGDLTEIAFALGAGDAVVGVDQTSTEPVAATALPQIGYVRRLSAEGVLALAPDLVLAAADAGPEIAFDQLAAAGVAVARAPGGNGPDSVVDKIVFVGAALGRPTQAAALADLVRAEFAAVAAKVSRIPDRPRVLFVLSTEQGAPLVAGSGTSADAMIGLAGGVNAAAGIEGFKPMAPEAILAAVPDLVLMMAQHAARAGGIGAVLARPDFAQTPAGRAGRGVTMEGMLLLGFGPRSPQAVADLARALHPGAAEAGL